MQNLDQGMEEFDNRLQHSALIVAACVVNIHSHFSDTAYAQPCLFACNQPTITLNYQVTALQSILLGLGSWCTEEFRLTIPTKPALRRDASI